MKKGVSELISTVLMVLVTVVAVAIVLSVGLPTLNRAKEAGITNEAMKNMQVIDNTIKEVASEGVGSFRAVRLQISDAEYRIFNYSGNNTGAVEFRFTMDYNPFSLLGIQADGNVKTSTGLTTRGLVGYWRLNKINSTNYTLDESGKKNDASVITGGEDVFGKQASGKYGYGLDLDGSDDYVSIADNDDLDTNDAITFQAWIKTDGANQDLIRKWETTNSQRSWGVFLNSSGNVQFSVSTSGIGANATLGGATSVNDSSWHLVSAVYNGSHLRIFIDAKEDETPLAYSNDIYVSNSSVKIGSASLATNSFDGTIDEVKIYNRALSEEDIQENLGAKQSDFRVTIDYNKINLMGSGKFGKGNQKACIEKTGTEGTKAIVGLSVC